ncbi:type VI secretion system membrane subunit TssM [Acerihabitans sp. TG2]|uniref:type VI secretion system membrane subunit TssM n=1 Tax=Acerihabitans sp. TG2 TaxID=3096008 RepID=UPI002B22314A|nr:type VI secretion system membrane subunit TssM [Acerihabitans sp. TG2]MEA9390978.1 type VI secretion system membrane subunit TssM [Acerihabitans sp. TG2]
MLKTLSSITGSGLFWRLMAIAGLCLGIWVVGPLIAIGELHPLDSAASRQLTMAAVVVLWLLLRLIPSLQQARFQRRLRRQLQPDDAVRIAGESVDISLAEGFKQARRILRRFNRSRLVGKNRWLKQLCGQSSEDIPWYLVLGASDSGKTKTLQSAGLDFLDPASRPDNLAQENRAPEHCDWYFTPQGVLISPAGRFLTEGNPLWFNLLGLIKRYRPRQPLNGVVLALSAHALLHECRDEQHRHAMLLRKRLIELRRQFGIDLPIYIMITKADHLAGFSCFYGQFEASNLEQAWGMSIPWDTSVDAGLHQQAAFEQAYDRLQARLNAALGDTLLAEDDPYVRARSFVFPQAFAAFRPLLLRHLSVIFASSRYDPVLSLRGIYFTSANQKTTRGKPLAPVCKDNVFDYRFTPQDIPIEDLDDDAPQPQSYFLTSLFRDIIFAESGLAGHRHWALCRRHLLFLAACGVLSGLLFLAGGYSIASFNNNQAYLSGLQTRIQSLEALSTSLLRTPNADLAQLLPFFDELYVLAHDETFSLGDPPLDHRMGLYRGATMASAANVVYQHALKRLLLPLVARQSAAALGQADFNDTEYTYQALKAYLMLHEPTHYNGDFLLGWVTLTLPHMAGTAGLDKVGRQRLQRHLANLINGDPLRSPDEKDTALIEVARRAIQQKTVAQRVYHHLKQSLLKDSQFKPVSLVDLAGASAEQELVRNSGIAINEPVPGLFTPTGYWLGFQARLAGAITALRDEDRWVLNPVESSHDDEVANNVTHWYLNDFILQWDTFLHDIGLMQALDLNQRINRVRVLSGERSPLRKLVIGIGQILSLPPPENISGRLPELSRRFSEQTTGMLNTLFYPSADPGGAFSPEQVVRNHYRDLIDLARVPNEQGDRIVFDDVLQRLDSLYRYLLKLQNGDDAAPGDVLLSLRADALRLPAPLRNLVLTLADGAGHDGQRQVLLQLHRQFDSDIGEFYHLAIENRYPLTPGSVHDLSPDDLTRLFSPKQGLAASFYQRHLADKVIISDNHWRFLPWMHTDGRAQEDAMLRFFRYARQVSDAFFPPDATRPSFSFTLRPLVMDNKILSLSMDIDGQVLSYNHGQPVDYRLVWPGPRRSGMARLTMKLADGTVKSIERHGPWAINRLLDSGKYQPGDHPLSRRITFQLEGHAATVEVIPDSVRNPFNLARFKCAPATEMP